MEAIKNPEGDNCHQVIFKELDKIKTELQCLHCHTAHHLRNAHTLSVPSFRKITEVDNRVVPGQEVTHFKNRHHLDDTEMRKALRWNHPEYYNDAVKHYEAKRQTFCHEAPVREERIVYQQYYEPKKKNQHENNAASRPPAGYSGRKQEKVTKQTKTNPSKLNTPRSNTEQNGTRTKNHLKNPENTKIKRANRNFTEQNIYKTNAEYQHIEQPSIQNQMQYDDRSQEGSSNNRNSRNYREDNQANRRKYNKKNEYISQKEYQSRYHSHENNRNGEDYRNGNRFSFKNEQDNTNENQNIRREGYVTKKTTKKRVKIQYDDITASSDSYFSPYEQQL